MAGSGILGLKTGLRKGLSNGGSGTVSDGELIPHNIVKGYGTPTHSAPLGTIYVKLDATMGTTSHYRCTVETGTWKPMSDD